METEVYKNGEFSICQDEYTMGYPRLCAHRGFNSIAPENSLPAYGAAVALGADEIELDVWATKDGVLVSSHDATLERTSDGSGNIYDKTYSELLSLDFGAKHGERFKGLRILTFEEILQRFACRVIMNIHVKIWDMAYLWPAADAFKRDMLEEIVALIRKYGCERYCYFMSLNDEMLRRAREYAPEIRICLGWNGDRDPLSLVKRGIALGAPKIQLYKPFFNKETVKLAKEHGIICNVFWCENINEDPAEARSYIEDWGIETVLTNDFLTIYNATRDLVENKKSYGE